MARRKGGRVGGGQRAPFGGWHLRLVGVARVVVEFFEHQLNGLLQYR